MKRTHKLKSLANVQQVVAKAPSLDAAAKQLGVNRSTLTRWMQQGKVARPKSAPATTAPEIPAEAEGWKESVLANHLLSETDKTIIDVADDALRLSKQVEAPAIVRLSAMGRFAALVRQLNLEAKRTDAVVNSPRNVQAPAVRRTGTDPRAILMAVK